MIFIERTQKYFKLLDCIIILLIASALIGQTGEKSRVIDNGGGSSQISNIKSGASIGQAVCGVSFEGRGKSEAGFMPFLKAFPDGFREHNVQPPISYKLSQNYPNPFNSSTSIDFEIPDDTNVNFYISDINGKVYTQAQENIKAGAYTITVNGDKLQSGVYLYTIETNKSKMTKKMILAK